jgi:hypothetical protein
MMAALAADMSGWDFRIYSRKVKSPLYGAQYLHKEIPKVDCGPPHLVKYELTGTPEQYRQKVYGPTWDGTVSPEDLSDNHNAWSLRRAYKQLWRWYNSEITDSTISPLWHDSEFKQDILHREYDLVVSTVPRKIWAEPGDVFESTKVWALGDTESDRVPYSLRPPMWSVHLNGMPQISWYRVSNIYGYCTVEWPYTQYKAPQMLQPPPISGASIVEKPLRHNSKAASDFIHLGRYGAWEKGILTSDVFDQAWKVFQEDKI